MRSNSFTRFATAVPVRAAAVADSEQTVVFAHAHQTPRASATDDRARSSDRTVDADRARAEYRCSSHMQSLMTAYLTLETL
jgi:hypothetical protein